MENKVLPINQPSMCIYDNLSNNRVAGSSERNLKGQTGKRYKNDLKNKAHSVRNIGYQERIFYGQ